MVKPGMAFMAEGDERVHHIYTVIGLAVRPVRDVEWRVRLVGIHLRATQLTAMVARYEQSRATSVMSEARHARAKPLMKSIARCCATTCIALARHDLVPATLREQQARAEYHRSKFGKDAVRSAFERAQEATPEFYAAQDRYRTQHATDMREEGYRASPVSTEPCGG